MFASVRDDMLRIACPMRRTVFASCPLDILFSRSLQILRHYPSTHNSPLANLLLVNVRSSQGGLPTHLPHHSIIIIMHWRFL